MNRLLCVLALAGGCTVERTATIDLGDFDVCPDGQKVAGVDPASREVLCEDDIDTVYQPGFGIRIADQGNPRLIEVDTDTLPEPGMAIGARVGLHASSVSTTAITVEPGACRDTANLADLRLTAAAQADIKVASQVDTVAGATPAWYFVYLVDDGNGPRPYLATTADGSTLSPGPFRLLGALYWDGGAIVPFRQSGGAEPHVVQQSGAAMAFDNTMPGIKTFDISDRVPPGTELVTMSAQFSVAGTLSVVDTATGIEQMVASHNQPTGTTFSAPISSGELSFRYVHVTNPNDTVDLDVLGYEWGPQETLPIAP